MQRQLMAFCVAALLVGSVISAAKAAEDYSGTWEVEDENKAFVIIQRENKIDVAEFNAFRGKLRDMISRGFGDMGKDGKSFRVVTDPDPKIRKSDRAAVKVFDFVGLGDSNMMRVHWMDRSTRDSGRYTLIRIDDKQKRTKEKKGNTGKNKN